VCVCARVCIRVYIYACGCMCVGERKGECVRVSSAARESVFVFSRSRSEYSAAEDTHMILVFTT